MKVLRREHAKITGLRSGIPLLLTLLVSLLLVSCGGGGGGGSNPNTVATNPAQPLGTPLTQRGQRVPNYQYQQPISLSDGIVTEHIAVAGVDANLIDTLIQNTLDGAYNAEHSILIAKDGKLVVEEYFDGFNRAGQWLEYDHNTPHVLQSVTKSVNSLLFGIAMEQGYINDVDQTAQDLLNGFAAQFADPAKQAITLEDMLTMRAGFQWDEGTYPYTDIRNDRVAQVQANNTITFVLDRPLVQTPGTAFVYNSGVSVVLARIITDRTGVRADNFARMFLFDVLNMGNVNWRIENDGNTDASGGLSLTPRNLLKIGQLVLDGGRWQGVQVVPETWITESTTTRVLLPGSSWNYGYQWWTLRQPVNGRVVDVIAGNGYGGQYLFIVPELNLVVVFTAGNYDRPGIRPEEQLQQYILPATDF